MSESNAEAEVAWGVPSKVESRLPASIAVVVAMLFYTTLPSRYTWGPAWLIPILEFSVLLPLSVQHPIRKANEDRAQQVMAIATIAIVNIANFVSLGLLVHMLVYHGKQVSGPELLYSSVGIWVTNVITFSLWYWELDRGGPDQRTRANHSAPDFLFPQMSTPGCSNRDWTPLFIDYLYISFTNATAFSPTDVMPLSRQAKMLMLLQSVVSLVTITLVAARAVNILS